LVRYRLETRVEPRDLAKAIANAGAAASASAGETAPGELVPVSRQGRVERHEMLVADVEPTTHRPVFVQQSMEAKGTGAAGEPIDRKESVVYRITWKVAPGSDDKRD
jgi:hypothetical protein